MKNSLKILINLGVIFAWFVTLDSKGADRACQSLSEIQTAIEAKQKSFLILHEKLSALNEKKIEGAVPLSGLFTIALSDEEAVLKRTQELRAELALDHQKQEPYRSWLGCVKDAKTKKQIEDLILLSQKVVEERLKFLSASSDTRAALASAYEAQAIRNQDLNSLTDLSVNAKSNQEQAQAKLEVAESNAANNEGLYEKDYAGYQALVAKYLVDLEAKQIEFLEYQKKQTKKYADYRAEIGVLLANVGENNANVLYSYYQNAALIWRELVDHIFELYLKSDFQGFSVPPEVPEDIQRDQFPVDLRNKYFETHQGALQRSEAADSTRSLFISREKEMISDLLLTAGVARSALFNKCRKFSCADLFQLNETLFHDFMREIKVIPFKLFSFGISKSVEFKSKLGSGVRGWVDITRQAFFLFLFLVTPVAAYTGFGRLASAFERMRKKMISRSMISHAQRTALAIWLGRVTQFFPWIAMWLTTHLVQALLKKTDVRELAIVLAYLKLYFVYRIVREVLTGVIQSSFARGSIEQHHQIHERVVLSATRLARLGLIEIVFLKATSDAVREVYVYTLFLDIVFWGNIAIAVFEASNWQSEIWSAFKRVCDERLYSKLQRLQGHWIGCGLNPILFIWVLLHTVFSGAISRLFRLDLFKWIGAEIFRKRLERNVDLNETQNCKVPADYLEYFAPREAANPEYYVSGGQKTEHLIADFVLSWDQGHSHEDALVLCGNRGMGKSSALKKAAALIDSVDVILMQLKRKYTTKNDFFELLSELVGQPVSSIEDFVRYDAGLMKKKAFFIDDFQNMFLCRIGGLDAYQAFLDIASLPTQNVFWCVVVNIRSWDYLKGVFGSEHFYGRTLEFAMWKDTEIQEMILKRHRLTGYALEFDDLIKAIGDDSTMRLSETELQFFRLLWGQSRGNPRSALTYWTSALSWTGGKTLRVGVPTFLTSSVVNTLSDDSLFVLAAITRHENLTFPEIHSVTGISHSIIRKSLKKAEGLEILWEDSSHRYRVSPKGQYLLDYYLLGKNFLHE